MDQGWRDLEFALENSWDPANLPAHLFSEDSGCPLADRDVVVSWEDRLEKCLWRPSPPQKCSVYVVRKLMGFGARKIQVKILILPPANHVTLVSAEKSHLTHAVFPPLGSRRAGLRPGTLRYQEVRALTAYAGFIALCVNDFACSRFNACSFALPYCLCHVAPGQSHCSVCSQQGGNGVSHLQDEKGVCRLSLFQLWD